MFVLASSVNWRKLAVNLSYVIYLTEFVELNS